MANLSYDEQLNAVTQELLDTYSWHGVLLLLGQFVAWNESDRAHLKKAIAIVQPEINLLGAIEKYQITEILRSLLVNSKDLPEPAKEELMKLVEGR